MFYSPRTEYIKTSTISNSPLNKSLKIIRLLQLWSYDHAWRSNCFE